MKRIMFLLFLLVFTVLNGCSARYASVDSQAFDEVSKNLDESAQEQTEIESHHVETDLEVINRDIEQHSALEVFQINEIVAETMEQFLEETTNDSEILTFHEITGIPPNAIRVGAPYNPALDVALNEFRHGDKQYFFDYYFTELNLGDFDFTTHVHLYFSLSDDVGDRFYFIGEYVGIPYFAPNWASDYGMEKETFGHCLSWLGGGGFHFFLVAENDELFIYAAEVGETDRELEYIEPVPVLVGVIDLR